MSNSAAIAQNLHIWATRPTSNVKSPIMEVSTCGCENCFFVHHWTCLWLRSTRDLFVEKSASPDNSNNVVIVQTWKKQN